MADLALTGIMAVWGSSFAVLRGLMDASSASPLALVAVRMGIATVLLTGYLALTGRLNVLRGAVVRDGLLCGALLGVGFLLQIEGLQRTTASRSGFLTGLLVVMVPLLEFAFFRKRPPGPALLGVVLAFGGMTILSAPWADSSAATLLGDWLTVGCAIVFAGHIIALGKLAPRHPVLPMVLLQLATTCLFAVAFGPLIEAQHFAAGQSRLWLALLYLAVFATLAAFAIQTWAQKTLPPVRVALISSLEPVFAAIWAAVLIGERLTAREFAGGALIVAGVAVGEAGAAWARARA
jgi:drug/metabolite transporter (DMT)-like permease